jgi:EAL domain-containing protein (putative c-di-GMP-specific phosphodiesterase class I)
MARHLGMRTVAEGIETRDDWDLLRTCGCDVAQGYFIGRPMPASELLAWRSGWARRWQEMNAAA